MKRTVILIVVDCTNPNIVYHAAVATVKGEIKNYFGTKNCMEDIPEIPAVCVTCEVTQDDINTIKKIIDNDSIYFSVIIGANESEKVCGDIIDLTK